MDVMVKKVQEWLNNTYGGNSNYTTIDEDGIAGNTTCKALVKAMQIELGITPVDGIWGEDTSIAFQSLSIDSDPTNECIKRQIYILQGGFYCKGIAPGGFTGTFGTGTESAVKTFETHAGLTTQTGIASAMIMKALLNTDAYTLLSNGDATIREIQQSLNDKYNEYIGLIPCDGVYAKTTCRALISGLQAEQKKEYSNTDVDGIWGSVTMNRCPTLQRYGTITNKQYVYLLQYALYVNGFDPNGFDGGFGSGVQKAVKNFQSFVALTSDGIVGPRTWASLMVSYGDSSRACSAADCMTPLTDETAALLVADGKTAVGRYITGNSNKCLTINELKIIYGAGLRLFPIYQTSGNKASYFTRKKGRTDAYKAYQKYESLHIPDGAVVYFAVDYDASITDITEHIIPYFEGINERLNELGNAHFGVGVYAPRYVCTQLQVAGLTISSFVCDMSSGFACNIGRTLPENWAFDQIKTLTLSNDNASLEIDNDYTSERDSSIFADPDSYQEVVNPTLAEYNVISKVCDCFGIDTELLGVEFEYGTEFPLIMTDSVEMYGTISHSATAPDSTYKVSISVSNGEISSPSFVSGLTNVSTEIPIISDCVDFNGLALAVDAGTIQVEVSAATLTSGKPALALEITSVAVQSETNKLESVLSVGIKFVFSQDSSDYENMLQATSVLGTEELVAAVAAYEQMIELEKNAVSYDVVNADSVKANGYALLTGAAIISVVAIGAFALVTSGGAAVAISSATVFLSQLVGAAGQCFA